MNFIFELCRTKTYTERAQFAIHSICQYYSKNLSDPNCHLSKCHYYFYLQMNELMLIWSLPEVT